MADEIRKRGAAGRDIERQGTREPHPADLGDEGRTAAEREPARQARDRGRDREPREAAIDREARGRDARGRDDRDVATPQSQARVPGRAPREGRDPEGSGMLGRVREAWDRIRNRI